MTQPTWIGHELVGRYVIEDELGRGGMSAVYKASDSNLRRVVAVKIIHSHLSRDPEFVRRFKAEATAVAQLRHPNIVQVYDFDNEDETYFIVFEFVPGETLQARLQRFDASDRRMSLDEVIKIANDIGAALVYAHKRDIVHRDVKPANVMLNVYGDAILTDFGIVKILGGTQHTAANAVLGTARYMSPEQIKGEQVDARSDIYSFGVMLYETVGGVPPYDSDSAMTLMMMHVNDPIPDVRSIRADVPPELALIINRCLEKQPDARYQNMTQLLTDLGNIQVTDAPVGPPVVAPIAATEILEDGAPTELIESERYDDEPEAVPAPVPPATTGVESPAAAAVFPETGNRNILIACGLIAGALVVVAIIAALLIFLNPFGGEENGTPVVVAAMTESPEAADALIESTTPQDPTSLSDALPTPASTASLTPTDTPIPTETPIPTDTPIPVPDGMILIPGGSFLMGSDAGRADEQPEHTVSLSPYFIDEFEVTNAQYQACVTEGGCSQVRAGGFTRTSYRDDPAFANYPAVGVSWNQAAAYCQSLGKRLLTEAEWEYAASGPDNFTWPWGNTFDVTLSAAGSRDTEAVDAFPDGRSPFGVFNMAGNVVEWVADNYSTTFYSESDGAQDPLFNNDGNTRVFRGGSFANADGDPYRTSRRFSQTANFSDVDIGFRCAQDVP
jgi:formylglycine-generating enzyme required for sulfatase activity